MVKTDGCLPACGGTWPAAVAGEQLPFHARECTSEEAGQVRELQTERLREARLRRRKQTLEAIQRGLDKSSVAGDRAEAVLFELEAMWREDETFS